MGDIESEHPWRDKETLERLYKQEKLSTPEVAEKLDCSQNTVLKWLNKFEIETRLVGSGKKEQMYQNEEKLKKFYIEKEYSLKEMAILFNCSGPTILNWLNKFNIETRDPNNSNGVCVTKRNGYQSVNIYDETEIGLHRLRMLEDHSLEELEGMHVHHKNENKIDNRKENLELMTPEEHRRHHNP